MTRVARSAPPPALAIRLGAATATSAGEFERALERPEVAQAERLAAVLRAARGSQQAGHVAGFERIRTARDFQDAIPLCTADQLEPDIERIAQGEPAVLTRESVLWFERSGGSSGACKRIPYTAQLLGEFQAALLPWLFDLARSRPRAWAGPGFWSVSPIAQDRDVTPGGIPIGSVGDSAYFPPRLAEQLATTFAVPGEVAHLPDVESCRYVMLRLLLERDNLAFVSAWNPSFMSLMMEDLERHAVRLLEDLERGTCRPPAGDGAERRGSAGGGGGAARDARVKAIVERIGFRARARRARALRTRWAREARLDARALWPELALISVWTDAQAQRALPAMRTRFPGVEIQGKGLLASEGVVSIPWFDAPAPVLAVRSHFMEFIDSERPDACPLLAHELEAEHSYEVVISTGSGLLRYRLGDQIRVVGHHMETPCIRFEGRADAVSDLVGEKLSASRVGAVLTRVTRERGEGSAPRFIMLAPEWGSPPAYHLWIECDAGDQGLECWAQKVEAGLLEGFSYRYARELGQLAAVRAFRVEAAERRYEARCVALGQRAGGVKPPDLDRRPGWKEWMLSQEMPAGNRQTPAAVARSTR